MALKFDILVLLKFIPLEFETYGTNTLKLVF